MPRNCIDEKYITEQSDSTHLATVKSRGGLSFAEPRAERVLSTLAMAAASWGGKRSGGRARKIGFRPEREGKIRIIMTSVRVRLCVRREAGRRGRACSHADIIYMQHHERAHLDRRTDGRTEEEGKSTKPSPSPLAQKGVRIIRVSRVRTGKDPYHLRDIPQYSKRGEGIELRRAICHLHKQRVIPIASYNARSPLERISLFLHEALQVATQASRPEEGEREDMNYGRRGASQG